MPRAFYDIVDQPAEEPVTVAEAKAHLRVTHALDDDAIEENIAAARRYLESQWGIAIIEQTWRAVVDEWPDDGVALRPHPVTALSAVKVWDGSAMADVADLTAYQLIEGRPARAILESGSVSPARTRQGIAVHFTAGWADAAAVPQNVKRAILLLVGHWYRNREASVSAKTGFGVSADLTRGVEDLMAPYRSPRLR